MRGLVGYLIFVTLVSIPAWITFLVADIPIPFYAIMGILITHQLSTAFIVSAFSNRARKKNDKYNILDFDKWN